MKSRNKAELHKATVIRNPKSETVGGGAEVIALWSLRNRPGQLASCSTNEDFKSRFFSRDDHKCVFFCVHPTCEFASYKGWIPIHVFAAHRLACAHMLSATVFLFACSIQLHLCTLWPKLRRTSTSDHWHMVRTQPHCVHC